jgi:hypothetical protein
VCIAACLLVYCVHFKTLLVLPSVSCLQDLVFLAGIFVLACCESGFSHRDSCCCFPLICWQISWFGLVLHLHFSPFLLRVINPMPGAASSGKDPIFRAQILLVFFTAGVRPPSPFCLVRFSSSFSLTVVRPSSPVLASHFCSFFDLVVVSLPHASRLAVVAWMVFVDWLGQQQFLCYGLCCHFQIFACSHCIFACDHHVFMEMLVMLY